MNEDLAIRKAQERVARKQGPASIQTDFRLELALRRAKSLQVTEQKAPIREEYDPCISDFSVRCPGSALSLFDDQGREMFLDFDTSEDDWGTYEKICTLKHVPGMRRKKS